MGDEPFNLIELGPGEGIKSQILLNEFMRHNLRFRYTPIDISMKYLNHLVGQLETLLTTERLSPLHADYFEGLRWQSDHSHRRNLVLFLGSSIGNFDAEKLEMRFYSPYLLQGLQSFDADKLTCFLKNNTRPIIFKAEGDMYHLMYLVMPVSANNA